MALSRTTPLVLSSLLFIGCPEEKNPATAEASASAGDGQAQLGGRVDEAVKGLATASAGQGDPNQPPPGGIFAPGVADRALAPGAPPRVQILGEGEDPKIVLGASVPRGKERVNLLVQAALMGKAILPPLVFQLDVGPPTADPAPGDKGPEPDKKAAPDKKPAPGPGAAPSAAVAADLGPPPPGDHPLVATIVGVVIPGVDEPPKEVAELFDAMKGATFKFTMTKTGPTGFSRAFAKQGDPKLLQSLDLELGAVEDALTGLYTPAPDKPVGEGAYWMVVDRRTTFGMEVVRYRVFTVKDITGDQAELSIQVKQYAVNERSSIAELSRMENPVMVEYDAVGDGTSLVGPGSRFPTAGQYKTEISTTITPGQAKGNPQAPKGELGFQLVAQMGPIEVAAPKGKDKPKAPRKP